MSLIIGRGNIKFFLKKHPHLHFITTPSLFGGFSAILQEKVPKMANFSLFWPLSSNPHFIIIPQNAHRLVITPYF